MRSIIFKILQHFSLKSSYTSRACVCAQLLQLCPTLCDPMDWSLLGCSVHGILQAGILEWVAMSCHVLLQGTFPTQGSNYCLLCPLHCRWILYCWATRESRIQSSQSFFLWIQQCVKLTILKFRRDLWIVYLKLKMCCVRQNTTDTSTIVFLWIIIVMKSTAWNTSYIFLQHTMYSLMYVYLNSENTILR